MKPRKPTQEKDNKENSGGFFKRLFGGKGGATKRKEIKLLKRELSQARIDLYKIKKDTISPPIARIIYEIYRLSYPLTQLLPYDKKKEKFSPSFEESLMLSFHPSQALQIYNTMNEEYIKNLILKHGAINATRIIEKQLQEYLDFFDRESINRINYAFSNFLNFTKFSHFDFFPVLREFDPALEEANFLKKPSFSPAVGSLLRDDLYKLYRLLYSFKVDDTIDHGIKVFREKKDMDPISRNNLVKLKKIIGGLQQNNYISLIIQAIDKSIAPLPHEGMHFVDVFHTFTFKRKKDVLNNLNSIKKRMQEKEVNSLIYQLFDGNVAGRIKNYSDTKNEQFTTLGLPHFEYTKPLNYVKAFLTDKYKPSIRKIINELIVGGIFNDKGFQNNLSNSYYAINNLQLKIIELDNDLDVDGNSGNTIKRLLFAIHKSESTRKVLEKTIRGINSNAKIIIDDMIVNLRDMAYCIKKAVEDYRENNPKVVLNIRKIRTIYNKQFIEELVRAYKDIFIFLKLLNQYVPINISRAELDRQKKIVIEQK